MTISISRYIGITSNVGGASPVPVRSLQLCLFTNNPLVPAGMSITFAGGPVEALQDVGDYFGTNSAEYARAAFVFGWVGPQLQQNQSIMFRRWVSAACAPQIYGDPSQVLLGTLQAITAGTFVLDLGGASQTIGPLNLSSAGSLAAVATAVQSAINQISGTLWSNATVQFNAQTGEFVFTGGVAGPCTISVTDGTQNLATALGWTSPFPATVLAPGSAIETIPQTLAGAASFSNNFGGFAFIPTLTNTQVNQASIWAAAQNVLYRFCVPVNAANAATISTANIGNAGTDLVLSPDSNFFPELIPQIMAGAVDWTANNSTYSPMFKQFSCPASVTDDTDANAYDPIRVNYMGQTEESGVNLTFYQRGTMCGPSTAPLDENTFTNESWIKSAAAAAYLNLQLALNKVSANTSGINAFTNALQNNVVQPALNNGAIAIGEAALTPQQQSYVAQVTGVANAWVQVQNDGYWLKVVIKPYTDPFTNLPGYKMTYLLVYRKDNVVRYCEGENTLV